MYKFRDFPELQSVKNKSKYIVSNFIYDINIGSVINGKSMHSTNEVPKLFSYSYVGMNLIYIWRTS